MVQCKKCKLFLSMAKDDIFKCKGVCDGVFHKRCVKKKVLSTEICDDCQQPKSSTICQSPTINIDPQKISVELLLVEMNKKLEVIFKLEKKIDDLTENVDFYAEQYQEMIEFKKTTENKIKALEQKNVYLEKCNAALEERVKAIEKNDKEKNIEIACLSKNYEDENILEVVKDIAVKLNLNPEEIENAERINIMSTPKSGIERPRPVVVRLKTKAARDQWLQKRKTRLTNGKVYGNNNATPIYINEDLPKATRSLFWDTRNELKHLYKFIWIQNSNILVKKHEDGKTMRVRNENDIKMLSQNNNDKEPTTD